MNRRRRTWSSNLCCRLETVPHCEKKRSTTPPEAGCVIKKHTLSWKVIVKKLHKIVGNCDKLRNCGKFRKIGNRNPPPPPRLPPRGFHLHGCPRCMSPVSPADVKATLCIPPCRACPSRSPPKHVETPEKQPSAIRGGLLKHGWARKGGGGGTRVIVPRRTTPICDCSEERHHAKNVQIRPNTDDSLGTGSLATASIFWPINTGDMEVTK